MTYEEREDVFSELFAIVVKEIVEKQKSNSGDMISDDEIIVICGEILKNVNLSEHDKYVFIFGCGTRLKEFQI